MPETGCYLGFVVSIRVLVTFGAAKNVAPGQMGVNDLST